MKYDFVENFDEFLSKRVSSYYDMCLWLMNHFYDIIYLIEGDDESESNDIGEITPDQKLTEFLSNQNLFNPTEFNKETLSIPADKLLSDYYDKCEQFAKERGLSTEDAIVGFSQKQTLFMPNICVKFMTFCNKHAC